MSKFAMLKNAWYGSTQSRSMVQISMG